MMYLPDTEPMALRTFHSNKQCINLNSNDFRKWYCAIYNPFNLLTYNLFRCHTRASCGVSSCLCQKCQTMEGEILYSN